MTADQSSSRNRMAVANQKLATAMCKKQPESPGEFHDPAFVLRGSLCAKTWA